MLHGARRPPVPDLERGGPDADAPTQAAVASALAPPSEVPPGPGFPRGAALRPAHAIESNAGAGTGPVRGGLSSRRKKVVLGGSADASGVEDAQKLLQKCKPKACSRGGVGSKKQQRFAIRDARREQSELKRGVQWKDLVTKAQVQRGLVADQGAAPWPSRKGASVKAPIKATVGQSIVKGPKGLSQALGVAEEKKERGA